MTDYELDDNIFTGIEDELREHRNYQSTPPLPSGKGEPQGCGCLTMFLVSVILALFFKLLGF